MEKCCVKCKELKPTENFYKSKTAKDGLQRACKRCQKEFYIKNKLEISEYKKKYYENNYSDIRIKQTEYYQKNIERLTEKRLKNKKEIYKRTAIYKKNRLLNDPYYKFETNLRSYISSIISNLKCKIPDENKGIDFHKIYEKIGPKPSNGNYHLDHIIPLSKFDLTNPRHIVLAHTPENLQWLDSKLNLKKGNKIMDIVFNNDILMKIYAEITNDRN